MPLGSDNIVVLLVRISRGKDCRIEKEIQGILTNDRNRTIKT